MFLMLIELHRTNTVVVKLKIIGLIVYYLPVAFIWMLEIQKTRPSTETVESNSVFHTLLRFFKEVSRWH